MMDPKNPDDDLKNALLLRKLTTSLTDPYIKPLTTKAGYTAAPTAIKLQWLQSLALVDGESSIIDSLSKATMTWAKAHNKLKLLPPLESHHHHHHHHHHNNNNNNHNTNNHHKQKQTIVNPVPLGKGHGRHWPAGVRSVRGWKAPARSGPDSVQRLRWRSILTGVVKIFAQTPNLRFRIMEFGGVTMALSLRSTCKRFLKDVSVQGSFLNVFDQYNEVTKIYDSELSEQQPEDVETLNNEIARITSVMEQKIKTVQLVENTHNFKQVCKENGLNNSSFNDLRALVPSAASADFVMVLVMAMASLLLDPEFLVGLEREQFRKGFLRLGLTKKDLADDPGYNVGLATNPPLRLEDVWKITMTNSRWFESKESGGRNNVSTRDCAAKLLSPERRIDLNSVIRVLDKLGDDEHLKKVHNILFVTNKFCKEIVCIVRDCDRAFVEEEVAVLEKESASLVGRMIEIIKLERMVSLSDVNCDMISEQLRRSYLERMERNKRLKKKREENLARRMRLYGGGR